MPVHLSNLLRNIHSRWLYFIFLWVIGVFCEAIWLVYCVQYRRYSLTNVRLVKLRASLNNGCSNLTDLPCSLQMQIGIYLFLTKFLILYLPSISIVGMYVWHHTVRFSYCVFVVSILADVVHRTPLILYFDELPFVMFGAFGQYFLVLATLHSAMLCDSDDTLYTFCEICMRPSTLDGHFPNDNSTCARFYRWMKTMKEQLGVEEEKLLIMLVVGIVPGGCAAMFLIIALYMEKFSFNPTM